MNEDQITINVNSIKSIYLEVCFDNQNLATATGFLVKNNNDIYLITNRHVVTVEIMKLMNAWAKNILQFQTN